jgi:putative glycosyl hydrolase
VVPVQQFHRSLLVAAALALGVARMHAAPVRRVPPSKFGVVVFDLNRAAVSRVAELGAGLVRGSCNWQTLEPARGIYNWDCADNVIGGAARQGLRSYMTVTCTPAWANDAAGCAEMPSDITDWYDFTARFVARYSGFNTVLGVWNEPNLRGLHDDSGRNYALLFVNASNARNTIDPRFALGGPETSHHAMRDGYFARAMDLIQAYRAMAPQDIVAVHWYTDGPPLLDYMDAVNAIAAGQPVWLSETGYSTADAGAQVRFFDRVLSDFLAGGRPWWTHVIFYRLWDGQDCCTEAILRADFSAKPAFEAYHRWIVDSEVATEPPPERRRGGANQFLLDGSGLLR